MMQIFLFSLFSRLLFRSYVNSTFHGSNSARKTPKQPKYVTNTTEIRLSVFSEDNYVFKAIKH